MAAKYKPGDPINLVCSNCGAPATLDDIRPSGNDPLKVYATVRCSCGYFDTVEGEKPDKEHLQ